MNFGLNIAAEEQWRKLTVVLAFEWTRISVCPGNAEKAMRNIAFGPDFPAGRAVSQQPAYCSLTADR